MNTLVKLLRAEGYYDERIVPKVAPAPGGPGAVAVLITVDPGLLYRFNTIEIGGNPLQSLRFSIAKAGLRNDDPARASAVLDSVAEIKIRLPQLGNPFFIAGDTDVVIDHNTALADVTLPIDTGPTVNFGRISFIGTKVAKPLHLLRLARLKAGQPYDQPRLDDLQEALLATGLYSSLSIKPVKRVLVDSRAVADIVVGGHPVRNRTIAFSAGYGTTEGPRTEASWQHRNLLGAEERLIVTGKLGTIEQSVTASLRKSNFNMRDQNLLGNMGVVRSNTSSYRSIVGNISAGMERQTERLWQKKWAYSVQTQFQIDTVDTLQLNAQNIKTVVSSELFELVSLPSVIHYDSTSDLFDPQGGFRVSLSLTPEVSI